MTTLLASPTMIRPRAPQAAADLLPTCECGQALDCCHAGHCPRCGITLQT